MQAEKEGQLKKTNPATNADTNKSKSEVKDADNLNAVKN